jgi:sarcosine oxidase subunit beta
VTTPSTAAASTDVVVIGAGIVGTSCAAHLAATGRRVRLLERESAAGAGSTGRSAAGIRIQYSEAVNVHLSAASLHMYRRMPAAAYRATGYLFLVPHAHWDDTCAAAAMQRSLGCDVRLLSTAEAEAHVAHATAGLAGASFCPDDGVLDPHAATAWLLAHARSHGVQVSLGTEVTSIERRADGWRVGHANGCIDAAALVNASGAWAGRLGRLAGLDVPVRPARRMVFATGPVPEQRPMPLTVDVGSGVWFRPDQQRLLIGRSDPDDIGFSEGMNWAWLEDVVGPAMERFPWFDTLAIDRRASWWGYYEVTPDHQPLIGERDEAPGWFDACGFSGHGVQQAPAVGRVIAELVAGRRPFIDVTPLRPGRFTDPAAGHRTRTERLIV